MQHERCEKGIVLMNFRVNRPSPRRDAIPQDLSTAESGKKEKKAFSSQTRTSDVNTPFPDLQCVGDLPWPWRSYSGRFVNNREQISLP